MLSLRDSDTKLPMWSLVYLATISTSWPRSKGICTFTSAAPKASWNRDSGNRNVEGRPYSSPPWLWLFLPYPLLSLALSTLWLLMWSQKCLFESSSPAPESSYPTNSAPLHRLSWCTRAQTVLVFPQGRNAVPVCASLVWSCLGSSWPEHGGAEKTSPQWLPPGPAGGGEGNARTASS